MVILALDTTTASGSVALVRNGELLASHTGDPTRTHGERLPGDLLALLETQSLRLTDVDVYAVCSGPGSFTGLRVGLATIQALALVNQRSVVPVPTLETLAWAAVWTTNDDRKPDLVGAWMNAHRGEVFAALYRAPSGHLTGPDGDWWQPLEAVAAPSVGEPAIVAQQWRERRSDAASRITVVGDAVATSGDVIERALDTSTRLVTQVPALAAVAARVAAAMSRGHGSVSPHAVRPVYVRRPDAELARERQHRTGRLTDV